MRLYLFEGFIKKEKEWWCKKWVLWDCSFADPFYIKQDESHAPADELRRKGDIKKNNCNVNTIMYRTELI